MTKNNFKYSKSVNVLGLILVAISLFFVGEKIWTNKLWIIGWRPTKPLVLVIVFCSILYCLNNLLLSTAWQRLLVWFGQTNATIRECYVLYARSQIAKYIPGNVFHVAGRHVLGHNLGFGHGPLGGAALYEIVGLMVTSSAIALLGILLYGTSLKKGYVVGTAVVFVATLIISFFLSIKLHKIPMLRGWNFQKKKIIDIVIGLVLTLMLYVGFFIIIGGILSWVVNTVSDIDNIGQIGIIITTFAFSWIAGFITPGSPAGAGVREAIIVFSLSSVIGEPESLLVALIFRMITIFGDIVFFLSTYLFSAFPCR